MTIRTCSKRAFTLLELLVVIGIIALLATMGTSALRGFNAVNVVDAGNRQLRDDINMARNYALQKRTTVYMVFVPEMTPLMKTPLLASNVWLKQFTNRLSGQFTSYNFLTKHEAGDQVGKGTTNYLAEWKHLPNGVFINTNEFAFLLPSEWLNRAAINPESDLPFTLQTVPFPTGSSPEMPLPCIVFDYKGALLGPDLSTTRNVDEMITLTRGSIILPKDNDDKPIIGRPETIETPLGNWTNNAKVRIDWITGRTRLEERKTL